MMIHYLFVFGVLVAGSNGREYPGWENKAEFSNQVACQNAIAHLGLKPENARCLPKG